MGSQQDAAALLSQQQHGGISFRRTTAPLSVLAPLPHHGVLAKYVNLTTGCRNRYFVLQNGVLVYYKINHDHQKLSLVEHELVSDSYRNLIGAGVKVFDDMGKKRRAESHMPVTTPRPVVQGVMHLQVSRIRLSNADPTKFYITSAKSSMQLRAESEADRAAWVAALEEHTAFIATLFHEAPDARPETPGAPETPGGVGGGNGSEFSPLSLADEDTKIAQTIKRVVAVAASPQLAAIVDQHVQHLLFVHHRKQQQAKEKRRVLKARIRVLEEEKLALEQELLSESRAPAGEGGLLLSALPSFAYPGEAACRKRSQDAHGGAPSHHQWHMDDAGDAAGNPKTGACNPLRPSSLDGPNGAGGQAPERDGGRAAGGSGGGGGGGGGGGHHYGRRSYSLDRHGKEGAEDDEDETEGEDGSDYEVDSGAEDEFFDCPDTDAHFAKASSGGALREKGSHGSLHSGLSVQDGMDAFNGGCTESLSASGSALELMRPPPWAAQHPRPAALARRRDLPEQREKAQKASLWTIVKESVGKDLTRICLPVYFNEPLGALQKFAEELEYCDLLDHAANEPAGSPLRHLLVAAFAVSGYASTVNRTFKPFNPLETETFELVCFDKGFRLLSEKVSHHPTVMACIAEGCGWTLNTTQAVRTRFKGRYIELVPLGRSAVTFHDGETLSWNKVKTTINNIISGNIYLTHTGTMMVVNEQTQAVCKVKFKEQGFLESVTHAVDGHLEIPGKGVVEELSGNWDTHLSVDVRPGKPPRTLWRRGPVLPGTAIASRYHWNEFTVTLNDVTPDVEGLLPPTDTRLRPDQRMLEEGRFSESNNEKLRLEEKQRAARRNDSGRGALRPKWFRRSPRSALSVPLDEAAWDYVGGYWEARERRDWDGVPRIFD